MANRTSNSKLWLERIIKLYANNLVAKGKGWRIRLLPKYAKPRMRKIEFIIVIVLGLIIGFIAAFWLSYWLPHTNVESAEWALSTQAQAMAAILGLLIAAGAFRWRTITNQEEELRTKIHSYLKRLGKTPELEKAYNARLSKIEKEKAKKEEIDKIEFKSLGILYVIKKISIVFGLTDIEPIDRYLLREEAKMLSKVSNLSKESAIDMMDYFFRYPAKFILRMVNILYVHSNKYPSLKYIVDSMLVDESKLIAEQIEYTRSRFIPAFYITCTILVIAVVISIVALSSISSPAIEESLGPHGLHWVVGWAIGLSILGIYSCLITTYVALR